MSIKRHSTPRLVADRLKDEIRDGVRTQFLPGQARLAKELEVSVPSIRTAIKLLVAEGILEPPEKGKRICISEEACSTRRPPANLLIISPKLDKLSKLSLDLLDKTESEWKQKYPMSSVVSLRRTDRPLSHEELDKEVVENNIRAIVAFEAFEGWVRALSEIEVPIYRLAGSPFKPKLGDSGWGVNAHQFLTDILTHLKENGHQRILTPVLRKGVRETILEAYKKSGLHAITIPEDQVPEFPLDDEARIQAFWEQTLSRFQPTAVLCIYTPVLFSLFGFCQIAGLRIPSHLSVVAVEHHQLTRFLLPQIAAPKGSGTANKDLLESRMKLFRKWLDDDLRPQGYKTLRREFDWGKSVADIRS